MKTYELFIDGKFVKPDSGDYIDVVNPFNGEVIAKQALAGVSDTEKAIKAARKAFDSGVWSNLSREKRSGLLKKISDRINEKFVDLLALEVANSGSTVRKGKEDIFLTAKGFNHWSKMALMDLTEDIEGLTKAGVSKNYIYREPVGVVGAIIPWNFPLKMCMWKIGPALAAGCTIVLKPSEITPITALELAEIINECEIPAGVVNIIPGYGNITGETIVKSPLVDKVSFTGSTVIGRHIMQTASANLTKVTLECGGKSANIVLEDADIDLAVDGALYATFYHSGQACESGTRLFLPNKIKDEFIGKMVEKVKKMKLGDPADKATDVGPVVSKKQQERVMGFIEIGKKEGSKIVVGGNIPSEENLKNGFFVEPTIFVDVDNKSRLAQEEIFGPVLTVMSYNSVEEAIEMANDSIYGLGGAVWSKDKDKAMAVAKKLRTGTVWINEYHLINDRAPFGGYKQSGIGREFGLDGLKEYTEIKHIHVDELETREKKFWYDVVVPKG